MYLLSIRSLEKENSMQFTTSTEECSTAIYGIMRVRFISYLLIFLFPPSDNNPEKFGIVKKGTVANGFRIAVSQIHIHNFKLSIFAVMNPNRVLFCFCVFMDI